ncbi:transcription antitermination factor NusB [Candidatus Halobeggiatoa sp. HSG11]|nr:transcription antitermination factor NusB [Candidatus Halobeggiatoa sp. HSG11]
MARFKPKARTAARKLVLQALYQWQVTNQDISVIETQLLEDPDRLIIQSLSKIDVPYFKQILNGIYQRFDELDTAYTPWLDRASNELDPIELAILRIGSYELKYCQDIPFKVVINEAVELAKGFGAEKSHKYINGILDQLAKKLKRTN